MAGVNKVILIGNLGKNPELRYTPSNQAVANFSLATTERWSDRNGQRQERTEWHNIVAWGKLAELANQYLRKGRSAYIEGRITTRSWEDKETKTKRYKTEIVASTIQFLGGPGQGDADSAPPQSSEPTAGASDVPSVAEPSAAPPEDDLPF